MVPNLFNLNINIRSINTLFDLFRFRFCWRYPMAGKTYPKHQLDKFIKWLYLKHPRLALHKKCNLDGVPWSRHQWNYIIYFNGNSSHVRKEEEAWRRSISIRWSWRLFNGRGRPCRGRCRWPFVFWITELWLSECWVGSWLLRTWESIWDYIQVLVRR